jgi:hypothetical protein
VCRKDVGVPSSSLLYALPAIVLSLAIQPLSELLDSYRAAALLVVVAWIFYAAMKMVSVPLIRIE